MTWFDKIPVFSVDVIDHTLRPVSRAVHYSGIALGKYLSVSCTGCYRADLNGGEPYVPGGATVPQSQVQARWRNGLLRNLRSFANWQNPFRCSIGQPQHAVEYDCPL